MGRQLTWRQGAAQRRDDRNIKGDDSAKTLAASKDTKKWCQGKAGKEHNLKVFPMAFSIFKEKEGYYDLCCTVCGKKIAYHYARTWSKEELVKPDWVIEYEKSKVAP